MAKRPVERPVKRHVERPVEPPIAVRRRLPTHERRNEIVAAVIGLACERGPDGITTQAIAERVSLTHGALFRHFADKDAIWRAVFEWVQRDLGAVVDEAFKQGGEPLAVLERVFLAQAAFVARHPGAPRILYHALQGPAGSPAHEAVRAMVASYTQRVRTLLESARASGHLSPSLDTSAAATLFVGTIQGLAVQRALLGGESGVLEAARAVFPLLLDGFRGVGAR